MMDVMKKGQSWTVPSFVTAQGTDMMTQNNRSGGACAATVAAWRPPLQCVIRQIQGAP